MFVFQGKGRSQGHASLKGGLRAWEVVHPTDLCRGVTGLLLWSWQTTQAALHPCMPLAYRPGLCALGLHLTTWAMAKEAGSSEG